METTLDLYSLCVIVLCIKMFALSFYQGFHRLKGGQFVNPEDARLFRRQGANEEVEQVKRAAKAWRNDLENIPMFFALGAVYVLIEASPSAAMWLFPIFTVARILHSLTYILCLQPWRSISFAIGMACLFGIIVKIGSVVLFR